LQVGPKSSATFELAADKGFFTLHAKDARVADILQQLKRMDVIDLQVDPSMDGTITVNLDGVPLEKLIGALSSSQAFVYEKAGDKYKLVGASVTSQQKPVVSKTIEQGPSVQDVLGKLVLTNTKRPLAALTKRDARAILLQNAIIDTESAKSIDVPAAFKAPADTEYFIVQFDHPVSGNDRALLEKAGGRVTHYVPNAAYAVHLDSASLDAVKAMAGVVHVEAYHPYFKLSSDLLSYTQGAATKKSQERVESGVFNIMTFRGSDAEATLKSMNVDVLKTEAIDGRHVITLNCKPEQIQQLASIDDVQWIEPKIDLSVDNDLARRRLRISSLTSAYPSLSGEGVTVGIADSGIDFQNPGFAINPALPTTTGQNTRITYYEARGGGSSDGIVGDNDGHGTHVSGSVLGNGALSATAVKAPGSGAGPYATNQFAGVAPGANLVMLEDFNSFSQSELAQVAYSKGARVANNSWGTSASGFYEYGTLSAAWDALVRDADAGLAGNQEYIVFFSAGNAGAGADDGSGGTPGTIGSPGNAKNVITIGAIEQPRNANNLPGADVESDSDWQIASYSSRGPTTDKRFKPDIVTPGSYVMSVQSRETLPDDLLDPFLPNRDYRSGNVNSGTNFAFFSGTSMATPIAAGAGALIYQYYTNTFGKAPSPALMKAIMVSGARMVHSLRYGFPYDNGLVTQIDQGFGLLDLRRSLDGPRIHSSDQVVFLDENDTAPVGTAESYTRQVTLNAGEGGLKIALAWLDPAGTPGNSVQLVNDIDLIVHAPGGGGYLGNQFDLDGTHSRKFESPDPVLGDEYNNVESIVIRDAPVGTYTIEVRGYTVPNGAQDFALVIMKGIGIEGRSAGDNPSIALNTSDNPVIAYSDFDDGGHKQIYVKQWVGPYGDLSDLGQWKRLEDQWFGIRHSARLTGISQSLEDSQDPAIATHGQQIFVAWVHEGQDTSTPDRIFFRQYDGTDWVEAFNSAHDTGISGAQSYDASEPAIAVARNTGYPVVAWKQKVLTGNKVFVALRGDTSWFGLGGSESTGVPGSSVAASLDVCVDSSGFPVVAWKEQTTQKIAVRRWNGSAWTDLGNQGNSPYAGSPKLVNGPNGEVYLTWVQTPNGVGSNIYFQVFAAKWQGGVWSQMAGSTNYPGISLSTNNNTRPYNPTIGVGINGQVLVAWQSQTNAGNAILYRTFNGSTWSGVSGSEAPPGIASIGGSSVRPMVVGDTKGLPIIVYQNNGSGADEVVTYTVVGDRQPPSFGGLQTAIGGTNQTVTLSWLPAVDDISSTIIYRIYRGTTTVSCGTTPSCSAGDVFANQVATVTNLTSFTVGGLVNGQIYCFGVRASDTNQLTENNSVMKSAGPVAGTGDTDNDCLDNAREVAAGTEPCIKDTDGDGMWDGWEWTYSTNNLAHTNSPSLSPIDNGFDNVRTVTPSDGSAAQLPNADPDGDGASSYDEFQWWLTFTFPGGCGASSPTNRVSPDPTKFDTDGDGIPDGWEIINLLNPTSAGDAAGDADLDGFSNLNEYLFGSDPNNSDSDSDGLADGVEVTGGTNPSLADTDGDGLDDGFEVAIGSNPRDADSNDSLVSDGDVFQLGEDNPSNITTNVTVLLNETFETNSPTRASWTHYAPNPVVPFDLWHLSTTEPAAETNAVTYFNEHSTSTAYRAARDPSGTNVNAHYNGTPSICALQSPVITNAVGVSNLFVGWNSYFQTEPVADFLVVQARGGVNTNWFTVQGPESGDSTGWVHRVADISAFAGKTNTQVRFLFTANLNNNDFLGWWIDDAVIYAGSTIRGSVRDNNGKPVQGARVIAIGRGGVTNAIGGHRLVAPGKIFSYAFTTNDGSYVLNGLPRGRYYVKAEEPSLRDEFFNGQLITGGSTNYGFGRQQSAGVPDISQVSAAGWVDLRPVNAQTNCDFELERGSSASHLGVSRVQTSSSPVAVDRLASTVWNGSTSAPAFVSYTASNGPTLINNSPDWLTNAVRPTLYDGAAPGAHEVYGSIPFASYAPMQVSLREGEVTLVGISTNQGSGKLSVTASDGGSYQLIVDELSVTNRTPAQLTVRAGLHRVSLVSPNTNFRIALKNAVVSLGGLASVLFTTNDLTASAGMVSVNTIDINGNAVTGATIYVDGTPVSTGQVILGSSLLTPTIVTGLRPGAHNINVAKNGYVQSDLRELTTFSSVTNTVTFILHQSDNDFDLVGDALEVESYTNLFLYHRNNDPDNDGLNNKLEFDLYRLNNIRLNAFDADSDDDRMLDGAEIGYDGQSNLFAYSTLVTNVPQDATFARIYFSGQYLQGVDNFTTGIVAAAIECDRFESPVTVHSNSPLPSVNPALSIFTGIPASISDRSVSLGHNASAPVLADGRPDIVDTDGDGMWDGFEAIYGRGTTARLDVIECGGGDLDPDFDGLNNLQEFMGVDGVANTNDWSNPAKSDSDDDGIPDGWEYFYGFDPNSAADAFSDADGDDLVNLSEYLAGTNPRQADTDADFLNDGLEVLLYGSDPLDHDTDDDGLFDGREVFDKNLDGVQDGGFFPNWQPGGDIDHDGLVDGPTDWDTDGDGMPDGFEVIDEFGNLRNPAMNPYDPNDGDDDPDGDGLSNLQEYLVRDALFGNNPSVFGLDGVVWDYSTDPFNADSDGDGLPDGFETIFGLHPMDPIACGGGATNCVRFTTLGPDGDLDGDGLWNTREYSIRFFLDPGASPNEITSQSTHPWNPDTDADGLTDGEEDRTFRTHPLRQDSDFDRLTDGAAVTNRYGETESDLRISEYQVNVCTNCTWPQAAVLAQIPHPEFTNITGHLAVVPIYPSLENLTVADAYITSNMTNVGIGGFTTAGDVFTNWTWIGAQDWFSYQVAIDADFINDFFNITNYVTTLLTNAPFYLTMNGLGEFQAITTQTLDHYIVEWDNVPQVTNHFDFATNDLWRLVWTKIPDNLHDNLPQWERVPVNTNSAMPPARWGAGMTYIPVFETKNPKDDRTGTILMDNRKLVVIGGTDGTTKNKDVWEFDIRSNMWHRSLAPMTQYPQVGSLAYGLGELTAVPIFGYHNTKSDDCKCAPDPVPYNCDGTGFLEPKNRPYSDSRSFDWTYIFGGWDDFNSYFGNSQLGAGGASAQGGFASFYKSTDSRSIGETILFAHQASEFIQARTVVDGTNAPVVIPPIVRADTEENDGDIDDLGRRIFGGPYPNPSFETIGLVTTYTTNTYLGTNGVVFTGLNGLGGKCEQLLEAKLEFPIPEEGAPTGQLGLAIFAEFDNDENMLSYSENRPSQRFTNQGWRFNSATMFTNIPAGYGTTFTVDVFQIVSQTASNGAFDQKTMGFVIYATNVNGTVAQVSTNIKLTIRYTPSYATQPYWDGPGTVGNIFSTHAATKRKSTAMVYDYKLQNLVLFGGIDGNDVLGDTHEGVISYTVAFEPTDITWTETAIGSGPPPRWGHTMVYDAANERTVMFGGFDKDHKPLNDLWVYKRPTAEMVVTNGEGTNAVVSTVTVTNGAVWQEITAFQDTQRPQPRGGASMVYWGDFDYTRGIGAYGVAANKQKIILFGGTDGKAYYNDTWVFDDEGVRWILVSPNGEQGQGPDPRAFASMVWAQNGRNAPDLNGNTTYRANAVSTDFDGSDNPKYARAAIYLFGGRKGTLPTGSDTDSDIVDDGTEYEIGGPSAGRDPRINRLIEPAKTNESIPFGFNKVGSMPASSLLSRGAIATLESLRHDEGGFATVTGVPYETHPDALSQINWTTPYTGRVGVDGDRPDETTLWYHRFGGENPFDERDVWALGIPDDTFIGGNGAPPYAYSGRWCYGTKLNGTYPNNAIMDLYSPLVNLRIPPDPGVGTSTNYPTSYFLVFNEWLDLSGSGDVVRVEALRPQTPADILTRKTGLAKPIITIVPDRNVAANTTGAWRKVIAPLDAVANETSVYFRFTLQTDSNGVAGGWYIDDVAVMQGGMISGFLTNAPNAKVVLYGANYNGHVQASTLADTNGFFQFGLLPLGNYNIGSLAGTLGPLNLGDTNTTANLGATNAADVVISSIIVGNPTLVTWPTSPGLKYEIDFRTNILTGSWVELQTLIAAGSSETYLDYAPDLSKIYRVLVINSLP